MQYQFFNLQIEKHLTQFTNQFKKEDQKATHYIKRQDINFKIK